MIVTIDGPAGSGKSTTAKLVAQRLGYKYIDSGATYRAVALAVKLSKIDPMNESQVEYISSMINFDSDGDRLFLDGNDITHLIRDEEIGRLASLCATYKGVRKNMVVLQRRLASSHSVICEGRDIGTVVFPGAEVKIYMDASVDVRASRRAKELKEIEKANSSKAILHAIELRDKQDRNRKHSPLRIPEGATIIDTTNLTIEEEVEKVIKTINSALQSRKVILNIPACQSRRTAGRKNQISK